MSSREARVSDAGAAIFLAPGELEALGFDPKRVDRLEYGIENGEIRLGTDRAEAQA